MLLAACVAGAAALGGCGSTSSQAAPSRTQVQQECTALTDVLADGPDPDADSVGYAEAQVLPLRQLHVADAALHKAVTALAGAYQSFSTGSGSGGSAVAVAAAQNAVNAICPGAAQ